ncbi:MAG: exonuclease SbcCD subunit D C-terminal domain-containing protein, partial [Streptosporangiaceae bacterium]
GSPLAFSFSERHHHKSVTLAEIDGSGHVTTTKLVTPVPRPLREVRGKLEDLLAGGGGIGASDLASAWVKVVLTDTVRPASPMERLRAIWPHTLVLEFEPEGGLVSGAADLRRLKQTVDPVEICELFVEYTSGGRADAGHRHVIRDVVEALRGSEAGADLAASGVVRTSAGLTDTTDPEEAGSIDEWLENAGRAGDWLDAGPAGRDRDAGAGGREERRAGSGRGDSAVA